MLKTSPRTCTICTSPGAGFCMPKTDYPALATAFRKEVEGEKRNVYT